MYYELASMGATETEGTRDMNDLYRGYEIKPHANGGFYWTDERGFDHTGNIADMSTHIDARTGCFPTTEKVMDDIDQYKRNLAAGN